MGLWGPLALLAPLPAGRRGQENVGGGEDLKMLFWPSEGCLGEELGLLSLENKDGLHGQHEEVRVDRQKYLPTIP